MITITMPEWALYLIVIYIILNFILDVVKGYLEAKCNRLRDEIVRNKLKMEKLKKER